MFDELLKAQIRGDPELAGMLATYNGSPAFFDQPGPADTDPGWTTDRYPRAEYNVSMLEEE